MGRGTTLSITGIFILTILFTGITVNAQNLLKNRLIVKGSQIEWSSVTSIHKRSSAELDKEVLCQDLGLFLLSSKDEFTEEEMRAIKALKGVDYVFFDQEVQERKAPNDALFDMQKYLSLIEVPKVWDITTGGKMDNGEDIVIVILDSGIESDHPDLINNIFVNKREFINDNIDNDGNGYIDDISGINVINNSGIHAVSRHGTWVSGIVGAEGNNAFGVSGINWKIKILPVSSVNNLSGVIKGYDYALRMKKLYLETNGTKGANVVVTNYSGGLDKAFGSDPAYKPWCDMYDLLGAQGILSVGSTTNTEVDVDAVGDMPSTCNSEFFIAVTSTNDQGILSRNAGFGNQNIDIAAPGEDVFNLRNGGSYFDDSGTSASSPIVAGTIALLYSVPCASFVKLVKSDKVKAARYVRDAVFNGASPTDELKTKVKYGGYLNAFSALVNMQDACEGQLAIPTQTGELRIEKITYKDGRMRIRYQTPDTGKYSFGLYDASGKMIRFYDYEIPAFGDNTFEIDDVFLPQGVYYINLISDNANAAQAVFVW
ncbi:MAG: S8 family serine peptidase [Saprospiraceae bacterium]|nr:S8 family serine peptidase [Saprospiraceae bacterium]